jgi:peptidoglycan biosynthesis protein MviN/MurJ (putative lipid II flippase)
MVQRKDVMGLVAINILIAAVGVFATMQIAWLFGANRTMDVWFLSSSLINGIFGLTQSGQLSELFLPEYIKIKHEHGQQEAFNAYCVVLNWSVLFTLIIMIVGFFSSSWIIDYAARGFEINERVTVLGIFRLLLPLIPLQILGAVQQMLGNAERKYGKFELGVFVGSIISILLVYLLHKSLGLWALVISQWSLQLTILIYRHFHLKNEELKYRWIWKTEQFEIRHLIKQLGHTSVYVIVTQIYSVTFRSLLGTLSGGVLSAYSYAEALYLRASSLFITPVGKVFMTSISTVLVTEPAKTIQSIRAALSNYLEVYFLVLAAGLPALSHALFALWGSERYGTELIYLTRSILAVFSFLMLFQMYSILSRKLNLALGYFSQQYTLSILLQVISIGVAITLIYYFGIWGAVGTVAFNTICLAIIGWFVTYILRPDLAIFFSAKEILNHILPLILGVFAGAAAAYFMNGYFDFKTNPMTQKFYHALIAVSAVGISLGIYKVLHIWIVKRASREKILQKT